MSTRLSSRSPSFRAAVSLQVDADHLSALRELGQVGTEHLDLAEAAVKKQTVVRLCVHGVVVVDAIDGSMASLDGLGCCGLHGRLLLRCVNDRPGPQSWRSQSKPLRSAS